MPAACSGADWCFQTYVSAFKLFPGCVRHEHARDSRSRRGLEPGPFETIRVIPIPVAAVELIFPVMILDPLQTVHAVLLVVLGDHAC